MLDTDTAIAFIQCYGAFFIMLQFFLLLTFFGAFFFISFGICASNSIEAHENRLVKNIMVFLSILGALSFFLGISGLITYFINVP